LRGRKVGLNSWKEKARGLGAAKVKDDMASAVTMAGLCSAIKARNDAQAVDWRFAEAVEG
jgi:hypothetical protein